MTKPSPDPGARRRIPASAVLAAALGAALPVPPTVLLLWGLPGCGAERVEEPVAEAPEELPDAEARPAARPLLPADEPAAAGVAAGPEVPADAPVAAPAVPLPTGLRTSPRTTLVYAAPRYGSDMRGRIDPDTAFAIYGLVPGTGCGGEGWAQAGPRPGDGYVCLKTAAPAEGAPAVLPVLPEGLVVPYIYAKPKADRKGKLLAEVPRYRNKTAFLYDKEPVDFLEPNRNYAFVDFRPMPGHGKVFEDEDEQIVPAADMKLEQPSEFFGRVLADVPVTEGRRAAWAVSHEGELRAEPKMRAAVVKELPFHTPLEVLPEVIRGGGSRWVAIPDALGPGVTGYAEAQKVRWWEPGPALADVESEELWVDVDLQQQMLAVYRGESPIFLTLISSGTGAKPNTATPKGTFRIRNKVAFGPMRNRPEDAAESPYHVEAVPWVQYFFRRFALHGAYWHNGFGHRKSHGCVNLAPRDAKYVYGLTNPDVPPGWMASYEHAGEPGSVVRVRKGQEVGEDRRTINDVGQDSAPPTGDAVLADRRLP